MATVDIFVASKQIAAISIRHEFYIAETSAGQIFWYEHKKDSPFKGGEFQIWLQSVDYEPRILFVMPHWQLIIDGNWMEKKFYSELGDLKGKKVELQYKEYSFVFQID